jgi:hypothetical protein
VPEPSAAPDALILQLGDRDPALREKAAAELFRRGCATAEPLFKTWFADPDFRALIRNGPGLLTVGIAVSPERFAELHRRFDAPRLSEVPPDLDAREFELAFAHGVRLDILTTRDPGGAGALARFLARSGEGIQQVECEVRDVSRATELLRERFSLQPVYPEPRLGADGTLVNFVLAPAADGRRVLIELVEVPAKKKTK